MEVEVKKISRLLASNVPRDDDELFEMATQNMSAGGDAIRFEVLVAVGREGVHVRWSDACLLRLKFLGNELYYNKTQKAKLVSSIPQ